MKIAANTVKEYLDALEPDRKKALTTLRSLIVKHLPKGFEEMMLYGYIAYAVPLEIFPHTYNGMPLMYVALASQKNYISLHLVNLYTSKTAATWFNAAYKKSGKKLNMGKACIRFKHLDELALDVIGQAIAQGSVKEFVSFQPVKEKKKR